MVSDESKEMLREFIAANTNCSIGDVAKYMSVLSDESKRLSKITTSKVINEFASNGIVNIQKPDRKGQGYRLSINHVNAFNLIDKWINETKLIAKMIQKNMDIIIQLYENFPPDSEHKEFDELLRNFDLAKEVVKMMIHILLIEIYREIKSNDDKLTLSLKIINLIVNTLKYTLLPRPPLTVSEYFDYSNSTISESAKKYGKNEGIQIEQFPYLAKKFEEFDGHFLKSYVRRGDINS